MRGRRDETTRCPKLLTRARRQKQSRKIERGGSKPTRLRAQAVRCGISLMGRRKGAVLDDTHLLSRSLVVLDSSHPLYFVS